MQEHVCFLKCLSTVIETCKNKMKIGIAANNEENFSMFVAICTYHRLQLTFRFGTKGVTPLETTCCSRYISPHHLSKNRLLQNMHLASLSSPDMSWALSESRSSSFISSFLSQSLFLKWLSHVHKPGHLPQMMLRFACWVPDDCFVYAKNCFFFSAFICVFCRAASSSFCCQSFSCREKHVDT